MSIKNSINEIIKFGLKYFVICIFLSMSVIAHAKECPSVQITDVVTNFYDENPGTAPFIASELLELTDLQVLQSLEPSLGEGTQGLEVFQEVWQSMYDWGKVSTMVRLNGHLIEIYGPIYPGEPSKRSNYFNLKATGNGMSGHLRPDNIHSIHSLDLPTNYGPMRGVIFIGKEGKMDFGIFLPSEGGQKATQNQIEAFQKTKALIASFPRECS